MWAADPSHQILVTKASHSSRALTHDSARSSESMLPLSLVLSTCLKENNQIYNTLDADDSVRALDRSMPFQRVSKKDDPGVACPRPNARYSAAPDGTSVELGCCGATAEG